MLMIIFLLMPAPIATRIGEIHEAHKKSLSTFFVAVAVGCGK
jgi:hypothetical protein